MTNEWMNDPDGAGWWEVRQPGGRVHQTVVSITASRPSVLMWWHVENCRWNNCEDCNFRRPTLATSDEAIAGKAVLGAMASLSRHQSLVITEAGPVFFGYSADWSLVTLGSRYNSLTELHEKLTAPKQLVWEEKKGKSNNTVHVGNNGVYRVVHELFDDSPVWHSHFHSAPMLRRTSLEEAKAACQEHYDKENA